MSDAQATILMKTDDLGLIHTLYYADIASDGALMNVRIKRFSPAIEKASLYVQDAPRWPRATPTEIEEARAVARATIAHVIPKDRGVEESIRDYLVRKKPGLSK